MTLASKVLRLGLRRAMHVQALPMWWGTGDNYSYIVQDDATKHSTVVDPAEAQRVLPILDRLEKAGQTKLQSITNTHHHPDHSGGNPAMRARFPSLPIVAGKDSPLVTKTPVDGERYKLGDHVEITAIHTPCHTQDSICYYVVDRKSGERAVFTGDTLFNAGCGRFFEGTPQEMVAALDRLGRLPKDTKVYAGHEYTKANAKFAKTVLDTPAVARLLKYCEDHEHTAGVFTVGDELEHNPFMRTHDPALQRSLGVDTAEAAMEKLRKLKNNF